MKSLFDTVFSFFLIILFSPLLILSLFIIWISDFNNPIFFAERVGINFKKFRMYKLRTMVINAEKTKVDSTSDDDPRITSLGKFFRKYKIDEIFQLINVLRGHMSFVGPRPNIKRETDLYSDVEKKLLSVKPGITDFSSIVFSDLGNILINSDDPNIAYNQLVRPWKSRLGLFYIEKKSLKLDLCIIFITFISIFSRNSSLKLVTYLLIKLNADKKIIQISKRIDKLVPEPPPGLKDIVMDRKKYK